MKNIDKVFNLAKSELKRDIKKYKNALTKKAQKSGLYENFGRTEIDKLKNKYLTYENTNGDYQNEMELKDMIKEFENWAMYFDLRDLQ